MTPLQQINANLETFRKEAEFYHKKKEEYDIAEKTAIGQIEKIEDELSKVAEGKFIPKLGERYYSGMIKAPFYSSKIWYDDADDNALLVCGFPRRTPEEAAESGKTSHYMWLYRSMSDVTDEMWEDESIEKFAAYWSYKTKSIVFDFNNFSRIQGVVYFSSVIAIQQAISTIGEDNFIKYVLGVNRVATVREVKCHAKVGEYIKLITTVFSFANTGMILNVTESDESDEGVYVYDNRFDQHPSDYSSDTKKWFFVDTFYVVLENYTPPTENFIYELTYDGATASFKIMKQPEAWRGKGKLFTASNGIDFASNLFPAIGVDVNKMILRGEYADRDNNVAKYQTSQSDYNRISSALIEFKQWADKQDVEAT